jgi:hypothetical protein
MEDRNGKDMKWMMKNGKKMKGKMKNKKRMKGVMKNGRGDNEKRKENERNDE